MRVESPGPGKGEHAFDKRLPIAKELTVGRFIVEIDGDSPVFTGLADSVSHGHPQVRWSLSWVTKDADKASQFQEDRGRSGTLPLKSVECAKFYGSGSEKLFDNQQQLLCTSLMMPTNAWTIAML